MKRLFLIVTVMTLLGLAVPPIESAQPPEGRPIHFPSGTTLYAEVVDTPKTRNQGLMFRDHLPIGGAMLFVFQKPSAYHFWMKNCKFAIDIIWLNHDKKVVYIAKDTPPCKSEPCKTYGPEKKQALYVLEVAAGFANKEDLKPGSMIQF
jgi:uncharacterized protein